MAVRKPTPKTRAKRAPAKRRASKRAPTIWEEIIEIGKSIPEEDLAKIPTDASRNLDHYLYGAPKKP